MKSDFLEELPKPGEPLQEKIAESNQRALEEELAERAKMAQSRLTVRQVWQLNRRYRLLHRFLNRHRYNHLIQERWQIYQQCHALKHDMKGASGNKLKTLKKRLKAAIQRGKQINARIAPLKSAAAEFKLILNKLRAHRKVLEWEQEQRENAEAFRREAQVWEQQIKAVMRQSPRLHHAGTDSKGRYFCEIPRFERVFFKEDRVYYRLKTTSQSIVQRFFGRWSSALPYGVDITAMTSEETIKNLSAATRRVVDVVYGDNGTIDYCISRLDSPDGIPRKILYGKVLNWYPVNEHSKTPWIAGVTESRKAQFYNFEDFPHVLIAGSTQSGKSNHVNQMIATLITMNTPAELRLLLIDLKGGIEFTHWSGIRHSLAPMVKTPEKVLSGLRFMRQIMERRLAQFEQMKAKNLASFNAKAAHKIPRLIIFIDEMATLLGLGELTTEIHNELRVLSSQGRAVGVHLVLCTQHSSVDVLPGWVKTNMTLRISGKMPTHPASMVILDTITAATLPPIPGRMVFSVGREEIIAQSPYISDEEISKAVALSKEQPEPDNAEFMDNAPVKVEPKFTPWDAVEIALTKLNGKLSPTRIYDEIAAQNLTTERKVRGMVEDIIEQGQIEHEGVTYRLRKERKYYLLEVVEQQNSSEADEDTEQFHTIERPIEDEHPIEEAVR